VSCPIRPQPLTTPFSPSGRLRSTTLLTFCLGLGGDLNDFSQKPIDEAIANLEIGASPPTPALPPEPDEWMRRLGTVPLQFRPGERCSTTRAPTSSAC